MYKQYTVSTVQFISVVQLCSTLCDPMDCNTLDFPVHHQLPDLAQTHVRGAGMLSNHLILCCLLHLLTSILPSIRVTYNESVLCIRWPNSGVSASASILPMNIQDRFSLDWLVTSPCRPKDTQESSPTPQFKTINSSAFNLLYGPTLTSIHDYWKNHNFD